jgi:anaerobic magnesium-protoporphyrin IX monomethyl ester cyclase
MVDIVFLTLPRLEMRAPITAPAILKAVVEKHGYSAYCLDLNLDLWHAIDTTQHGHVWFDTDLTFRYEDRFDVFWKEHMEPISAQWLSVIREKVPKWIGITLFSQRSKHVAKKICELIRTEFPNIQIVVGGPFSDQQGPQLLQSNLVDAYVVGEGEEAILNVLAGDFNNPGINGNAPDQISNLDQLPIPDYSDFKMDMYPRTWADPRVKDYNQMGTDFIYITGSRGCVRKCSFCDIESVWPKFRYRSGANIANEMLEQHLRYGSKRFLFTDSLINGSVRQLRELCDTLITFKNLGTLGDIKWQGQFIARPENNMPDEIYAMMKEAGCWFVSIGIESGSEKIRSDMKKQFDDKALDFTIKMCAKHHIEMAWLMLVGYPTETEQDFQMTLDFLSKYAYLNDKELVRSVALGPTLDIVPGSPLYRDQEKLGISWDNRGHWVCGSNTRIVRINRWLKLKEHCLKLGYPVTEKATEHLLEELAILSYDTKQDIDQIANNMHNIGPMGPSV